MGMIIIKHRQKNYTHKMVKILPICRKLNPLKKFPAIYTYMKHCSHNQHLSDDNIHRQLRQHLTNGSQRFITVESSLIW